MTEDPVFSLVYNVFDMPDRQVKLFCQRFIAYVIY